MKTAKILYVQHGNWVRITGFENVMRIGDLTEHFTKVFKHFTACQIVRQYMSGKRVGLSPVEYAYKLDPINKNEIELRKITQRFAEVEVIRAGDAMRAEDFEELLLKLQAAGDRLQLIVVSFSDKVKKASI